MSFKNISAVGSWKPFPAIKKQKLMSTVGSLGHRGPISFHNRCCWSIGSRRSKGRQCWGDPLKMPKLIFVACKKFTFFYTKIYPDIPKDHKYVLIIADEDTTVPRQIDVRYGKNTVLTMNMWDNIVNNTQILHIFVSHLDIPKSDRYSPIPVGFNSEEHLNGDIDTLLLEKVNTDIMSRPLKIKGCCRIRSGPQWNDRKLVRDLSKTSWSAFSEWSSIPKLNFFKKIQQYSFLFCPHGGGIEPNPKVFSAIYCCTIPIIKRFVNCEILYEGLPVVIIEDWNKNNITLEKLELWREELKPYFYDENKRNEVLKKLTSEYWLEYIENIIKIE